MGLAKDIARSRSKNMRTAIPQRVFAFSTSGNIKMCITQKSWKVKIERRSF